ncbi:MAG: DNA-directed RNA polymerase subunit A'' [Candidatus Aenigmatarchaeota archaeon]|nr:DNA-directed RNA polymerase subunit A'' [Nanoarchaeota archaeon]
MERLPYNIQNEIVEYVEKHKLDKEKQKKLIDQVVEKYKKAIYDPEEPVGVITAQSLSEPATQMTMRTYHFAGTAGIQVTLGLPRLLELFDARKEPRTPAMTIFIKSDFQSHEKIKRIAEDIKEIKVKNIMLFTTLDLTDFWIKARVDKKKIESLKIDLGKLSKMIKIRNASVTIEGDDIVLTPKKKDIKNLHKLKYTFLETHIKGIKGITQVVVAKENDEWVINTLGSNLKKVFDIEGVDAMRTTSNNIFEVYDVLGIDAARNAIINQVSYTMEEQGLGVNVRYIILLADLMTSEGTIKAIGRYGISGQKASVLVRASFEETKKHLTSASFKGEEDKLQGAIENIMLNKVIPMGTGAFDLVGRIPGAPKKARKKATKK